MQKKFRKELIAAALSKQDVGMYEMRADQLAEVVTDGRIIKFWREGPLSFVFFLTKLVLNDLKDGFSLFSVGITFSIAMRLRSLGGFDAEGALAARRGGSCLPWPYC